MPAWVNNPITLVIALLAVVTVIFKVAQWVERVNLDRSSLKELTKEIREDIKKILERLPSPVLEKGSPLRLSELGRKISEALGLSEWAKDVAKTVEVDVVDLEHYEIQDHCRNYVRTFPFSAQQKKSFRMTAYENGISHEDVLDVAAVELRDALIARLPYLGVDDSDAPHSAFE